MTYEEALDYLYSTQPAFHIVGKKAYRPGFENILRLMDALGNPHTQFPVIHVAGTNGKGSNSHLIAAALQAAGLKVGLYTSPHLVDYRERIRINGQMIPQTQVLDFVSSYRAVMEEVCPSFFESATAMCFYYFAKEKVDVAVVEVGLGGRLDSTNILTNVLLSVITNIGMDHTELLGDTLAKIAGEKAGIIKSGVPCVIGESHPQTDSVFISKAQECGIFGEGLETTDCKLWFADKCSFLRQCRLRDVQECELHGLYQEKNMQTAYVALRALQRFYPQLRLTKQAIATGFARVCSLTGLRGRWEVLQREPLLICDTGHNSHGIQYVAKQLHQFITNPENRDSKIRLVFGMVDDKDVEIVMDLLPKEGIYYFTQANTSRAIPVDKMLSMGQNHGLQGRAFVNVQEALSQALRDAKPTDIVFIGGSNYIVGEVLKAQC